MTSFETMRDEIVAELNTLQVEGTQIATVVKKVASIIAQKAGIAVET